MNIFPIDTKTEAKNYLIHGDFVLKVVFNGLFRKGDDYPNRFWRVNRYYINKNKKTDVDLDDFSPEIIYDVDTLEEAVASIILNVQSDIKYDPVLPGDIKPNLKNAPAWREEKIIFHEYYNFEKERNGYFVYYYVKNNDEYVLDYDSHFGSGFQYMLIDIPKQRRKLLNVPLGWDIRSEHGGKGIEEYPMFEYKGHLFSTTYYFPKQRAICGESDTYYNEYEGDNSIKTDIEDVYVFRRNSIYLYEGYVICNNTYRKQTEEEKLFSGFITSKESDIINSFKKEFPEAKELNTMTGSLHI